MFNILLSTILIVMLSENAYANIEVTFIEGAPKDKFVLNNTRECNLQDVTLKVDLSESEGRLIFDTTAMGKGVEVFQPFEVTKGQITLTSAEKVNDGDTPLSLNIKTIQAKDSVSFTIDVDDTLAESQLGNIRVTGTEVINASVTIDAKDNNTLTASFDKNGKALLLMPKCTA
jgi:hypothetical protein